MNKNVIASIIFAFVFFALSCNEIAIKVSKPKSEVDNKSATGVASVSSIVQPADSIHVRAVVHDKKRSCCVSVPSRFRSVGQLAKK